MADPDYISVRRPADAPFSVLPNDLVAGPSAGCELSLIRSLTTDGLDTPISVRPLADVRFEVVDGRKRLAAIRMLIRINQAVYDKLHGIARPASQVFALVRCRIR